ncbi:MULTISPECIES: MFS transporter [unclassified Stenotrophomonas]|uniref:MFS transporter n=1 Tax=unclassified Stenotrophomonas TaxID=196198 RepID=UPI000D1698AE|nr:MULTISPECIES: MFS transporter [unclassified Stenotrophomonas]PTA70056.1 MFS transporter [Stenotrophomonas sp. Nf1]PTA74763.1 MFS transporter [Stenotrophomonas sp. Nf4]
MPSPRLRHEAIFLLVFALDLVNMFIATVAYPALAAELHADIGSLAWVGTAYMLGLSVLIPLAPWLAARCGERRLLLVALLVFAAAAVLAGAAPGIGWLLGWRLLQGLAGGLLIPVAQAAAYRQCSPDQRGALTRRILLVALLVPALAPALGGLLVQWLSWRGVLWASLPLAVMAIGLVLTWMPPDGERSAPRLQAYALSTAMLALGALLLALTWLGERDHRAAGAVLLLIALLLAAVHLRHARRQAHPLLRWSLLSHRGLRLAMLVYLAVPGVFIGSQLVSTLQLHQAGYSAARIGALTLPWALASAITITASKHLLSRFGPATVLRAGMLLQASGLLLMALLPQPAFALAALLFALMGAGGSLCSSTAQTLAFQGVEGEALGDASALWNLNRQLSFCLGTAAIALLLALAMQWLPTRATGVALGLAAVLTLLPLALLRRSQPLFLPQPGNT